MTMVVVVVVRVLDVLAVVVEDVVDGPTRRTRVVVVGPGGRGAPVVLGPAVVVVTVVVVTPMHPVERAGGRQRSANVAGAAPGDTARRSRRVLPAATVYVSA
jgi:hypothetical protein